MSTTKQRCLLEAFMSNAQPAHMQHPRSFERSSTSPLRLRVSPTRSSMPRSNPNSNILTRKHQTVVYAYKCELCGLPCKTAGGLQRHKNARHGDSESEVRAFYLKYRLKSLTIASLPHHPTSLHLCKKSTIYPSSIATQRLMMTVPA